MFQEAVPGVANVSHLSIVSLYIEGESLAYQQPFLKEGIDLDLDGKTLGQMFHVIKNAGHFEG